MRSKRSLGLWGGMLAAGILMVIGQPLNQFPGKGEGPGDTRGPIGPISPSGGYTPTIDSYGARGLSPNSAAEHVRTLGFISKFARDIGKRREKEIPAIGPLVQQIQNDVKFLQVEWSQWGQKYGTAAPAVPLELDPYYRTLRGISKSLDSAENLPASQLLVLVRNVARDLRNKATNCRNSADGLGKQIVVSAKTVKGEAQVPGYEIFYVPLALLGQKGEYKRFSTVSSPATHNNVPPGFYAIWLKKENRTNVYTAQDIVADSSGKCFLEIAVPDEFYASR